MKLFYSFETVEPHLKLHTFIMRSKIYRQKTNRKKKSNRKGKWKLKLDEPSENVCKITNVDTVLQQILLVIRNWFVIVTAEYLQKVKEMLLSGDATLLTLSTYCSQSCYGIWKKLDDRSEDIGFHDFDPNWAQMVHLFHKRTFWENWTVLLLSTYCTQ